MTEQPMPVAVGTSIFPAIQKEHANGRIRRGLGDKEEEGDEEGDKGGDGETAGRSRSVGVAVGRSVGRLCSTH
jgi:hypothetical protein